jgi:HPt (histidine-containing phosphotransfer) domain-containing protein
MISNIIKVRDIQSIPEKAVLPAHSGEADIPGHPDRRVIDRKAALERTMGDEQFLSDLLQEFIQYLPDIKERIVDAIVHKNAPTLAKEANLLAGAAGNLGAAGLSDAAFDLEIASRKGHISEVHRSYRKLEQEVKSFIEYAQMG